MNYLSSTRWINPLTVFSFHSMFSVLYQCWFTSLHSFPFVDYFQILPLRIEEVLSTFSNSFLRWKQHQTLHETLEMNQQNASMQSKWLFVFPRIKNTKIVESVIHNVISHYRGPENRIFSRQMNNIFWKKGRKCCVIYNMFKKPGALRPQKFLKNVIYKIIE